MRIPTANMGEELSASDVRTALYGALEKLYPDTIYGGSSAWIQDYFPESKQIIFQFNGDTWRQDYELAETGEASLSGVPEKVTSRTVYEPAVMGSQEYDLSFAAFGVEGIATFSGKVFEPGQYPKQKITMSPEDNVRACQSFNPVRIKDTHDETQSVFAGKLGSWTGATPKNNGEVHATLEFPAPLIALFGADWKPKVSVEINRTTKQFTAIALLNYPQVTDAQVQAAFAEFAGSRHSKKDQEAIQKMHDLALEQGAVCPTPGASMGAHDPTRASLPMVKEQSMKKTPWERLMALFGKEKVEALGTEDQVNAIFAEPAAPVDSKLAEQMAKFESDNKAIRTKVLADSAAAFANDIVYNRKKALVGQLDSIKSMYLTAAAADGENGIATFGDDGQIKTGDAMKALEALFEAGSELPALMGQRIPDKKIEVQPRAYDAGAAVGAYNKGGRN